jgi:hypothetical protein
VGDRNYLSKVLFARMPAASCVKDKDCADYADWNRAWQDART